MHLDSLKTFTTLAEVKNFTKTADILHISQPSVSLHIKNLEKEFQTSLFVRSPKSLKITPTGEILYNRAKQIINIYSQTKLDILEHHHDVKGKLVIGASFTIGEYILPAFLVGFQKKYPDLDIEVMIGNTEEVIESVRLFKVDIGLIEGQTNEKELTVEPFMEDELFLVSSADHVLAQKKRVMIDDLHSRNWVTREEGSGTREYLEHVIRSNGLKVNSFLTISSNQGIKGTLISGMDALSLLSRHVIDREVQHHALSIIPLQGHSFKRKLSMVYSPAMESKMNVAAFIESLAAER
ncbi:LysR family transcriptional regulator [Bacillus mangrovi]|uniref:LysR family transcriptional regulator n=1 Tax=Metabacillus mangrovi TaxID=1491830 RepID=A0A7X2V5Z5_9BACI|nr:LysR family transcriptional regulator [Metabacillus mangrovi]MTH54704.1 LysR family transcriptional regulator [Metabacillus mangrovi]